MDVISGLPEGEKRVPEPIQDIGRVAELHGGKWGSCNLNIKNRVIMNLQQASIYSSKAIRRSKKLKAKSARKVRILNSARIIFNLPESSILGVYLKVIKATGWRERKSKGAMYNAVSRYLKLKSNFQGGFYNTKEWREVRYQALKLYGRACACCGATPESSIILHVDHIKPRSKYPDLELDINNLQILCADCNLGKSNSDSIDYRVKVND